jgi:hypothetical protein
MARKNLVLARVGAQSLHPEWLDPAHDRTWDLRLVPYQEIPDQSGRDCVVGDIIPGPKWSGIRQVLADWDGWRDYEHVWLPDDDIRTDQSVINRMFEVVETLGFDLFAPALDEASHFAHFSTMRNRRSYSRRVGFVEIMVPGFRTTALEAVRATLDLSETGWGWGLDSVWPKILGYENVGIIDGTAVTHTRPVGRMRDPELGRRVLAESDRLLAQYGCAQRHTVFAMFDADLQPRELSPEELLAELVHGWDYLIERDPRILSWIVDFQRASFPALPYPIEGTPESWPDLAGSERPDASAPPDSPLVADVASVA